MDAVTIIAILTIISLSLDIALTSIELISKIKKRQNGG